MVRCSECFALSGTLRCSARRAVAQSEHRFIERLPIAIFGHALLQLPSRPMAIFAQILDKERQRSRQFIDDGDVTSLGRARQRIEINAEDRLAAGDEGFAAVAVFERDENDVGPPDAIGMDLPPWIVAARKENRSWDARIEYERRSEASQMLAYFPGPLRCVIKKIHFENEAWIIFGQGDKLLGGKSGGVAVDRQHRMASKSQIGRCRGAGPLGKGMRAFAEQIVERLASAMSDQA